MASDVGLFDLAAPGTAEAVGATPRLGDTNLVAVGYELTQRWGRYLHASEGVDGLRYLSCRAADRAGMATVLWRPDAVGVTDVQHLLIDDALWPSLVYTLAAVDVAVNRVDSCARCAPRRPAAGAA